MPGPILPNTGIQLPALDGDAGIWDAENNACWMDYDVHDHAPGNGVRVPVAGLNINADLTMGGFGLTNLKSAAFTQIAALAAGATTIFVNAADHELYWRTAGGVNVKLTTGNTLNITFVGGIGGDYAAIGAHLNYDDANKRFTFQQETNKWARIATGGVRYYEFNTNEAIYTGIIVAPALAASYDITLPVALPGSQLFLQMDAAGVLTLSNTALSNVTAPDFRYTVAQTIHIPGSVALDVTAGTHTRALGGTSAVPIGWLLAASANKLMYPIEGLRLGDTIGGFLLRLDKNTSNANTVNARIYRFRATLGSETAMGAGVNNNQNAVGAATMTEVFTDVVGTGYQYYLVVTPGAGVAPAADKIYDAEIFVTRP